MVELKASDELDGKYDAREVTAEEDEEALVAQREPNEDGVPVKEEAGIEGLHEVQ